jgi:HD superfamily phosphohydrolase
MEGTNKKKKPDSNQEAGELPFETGSSSASTRQSDNLKIHKIFRLAVSGDVLLTKLEVSIVDTPEFQRLRRVRELGTTHLVYPTAIHTRFDHSLGTLAMADRMVKAIRSNTHSSPDQNSISDDQEILVRLYALLHDVPHIPYGHTLEDEFNLFLRHDKNMARIDKLLGTSSTIGATIIKKLGQDMYARLLRIFKWNGSDSSIGDDAFIYDIVSNTVCADLLDYIKRDSLFCGLSISFDDRFIKFLYLDRINEMRRLFVRLWKTGKPTPRRDTLSDLAGLLQARYLLAERAYYHHAKLISGAMLARAVQEAVTAGIVTEDDMYSQTDDSILILLSECEAKVAKELASALLSRSLHKTLHVYTYDDFKSVQSHNYECNAIEKAVTAVQIPDQRRALEDRLADEIDAEHGDVLLYAPELKMNMKAADMKVLWKGEPKPLKEIDDPVTKPRLEEIIQAHRMLWGLRVMCSPRVSERQRAILRKACDTEFVTSSEQKDESRIAYIEDLVELQLRKRNIQLAGGPSSDYLDLRRKAAEDLAYPALDRQSWKSRIEGVIRTHFGGR